jgi:DNA-binding IscR family transcriptional regulator
MRHILAAALDAQDKHNDNCVVNRDSRLSVALHVLMHVSEAKGVVTSEALGPMLDVNPVVVRRTMAGLRDAGIVRSEKGRHGGLSLARPLASVTLGDVYDALAITNPFGIGWRTPAPTCLLERTANQAIGRALADAEAILRARLRQVTVADLIVEAHRLAGVSSGARHRSPHQRT